MAITRAQQAKQMLQDGGRIGLQGGGKSSGKDPGPETGRAGRDDREIGARASRTEAAARSARQARAALGDPDPDVNTPLGRRDTITNFGRNLRANLVSNPFSLTTPLGTLVRTSFQTNRAQKMMGMPGFSAQFGDPTRNEEGDVPLWMQLGYSSEAEYNAAMGRGAATSAPVESDPPVDLNRIAYRLMADGGAVMDDEPRQAYGLGSIVKKATRAIKKVAKSDIGKLALLYAGTAGLGALGAGSAGTGFKFFGSQSFLAPSNVLSNLVTSGKNLGLLKRAVGVGKDGTTYMSRIGPLSKLGVGTGILAASALPFLMGDKEEEEERQLPAYLTEGIDIPENQYRLMAEGGDTEDAKEPVAKKVMPLIDMDGKEKDYRETGGFVDMGRMEKADDVPARLSKNEFVFTADAVRNAGDGSVDKGAEVMYNMMKNLEAGGEVSEESQGLEGARKMFQTSQRLEEVL